MRGKERERSPGSKALLVGGSICNYAAFWVLSFTGALHKNIQISTCENKTGNRAAGSAAALDYMPAGTQTLIIIDSS